MLALLLEPAALTALAAVTVDGAQTYQVIEGFGANVNHRSWNSSELPPVLDALIDQGGMTLFRVIFDKADWEATNDNSNSVVMNWSYYNPVYSSSDFQKLWDMSAYLNQRGITNGLMFNFQGTGPSWMLNGAALASGYEAEWAEMVASLLIYARNTQHLRFTLVGPGNEEDIPVQGIDMTSAQYVTALHKLSQLLDTNGLSDLRFVGPDLSSTSTAWLSAMMNDSAVMAKLGHFGLHSYQDTGGGSTGIYDFLQQSAYRDRTFWITEFNVWCSSCEAGAGGDSSWAYAKGSANYLFYHLANGASAGLVWEGYDSQYNYYSPGQWSYWGLFGVDDINAVRKTYTPRKTFYALSQFSKFIRPGARRVKVSGSSAPFQLLAFYHPDSGQVTLAGRNTSASATALPGTLASLPPVASFDLYYTDSTTNLCHSAVFPVTNGTFATTVPANCVFTLVGFVAAVGPTAQISITPTNAVVAPYGTQQFTATATDAVGTVIKPAPALVWSASGGGTIDTNGLFTAGGSVGGPFTIAASNNGVTGATSVAVATNLNLAPAGVGYTWYSLAASTGNSPQGAAPGINDGDYNTDVSLLASAGQDISNAYEAAGVLWSTSQTFNRVIYKNGSYNSYHDGVFAAGFGLQFSPDGTTWTNAGLAWTVAPAYIYNSAASANVSFTFTGGVATVRGVRCVGRVHTTTSASNSWVAFATELQAFAAPALPPPVLAANAASNGIAISWPAPLTNYILQAATNLLPSVTWSPVTNTPQAIGDRRTVTAPPAAAGRFFRLHKQ
jgi:O-glycosyl hydrolase